jgi:predicted nucleic acid-binding protein
VLLVDTGVLVAAADTDDAHHHDCKAVLETDPGPLVTNALVIAEAAYLIDRQLGPEAEAALFESITDASLRVEDLEAADWARVAELIRTYADLRLGGTDASLIALAERLGVTTIATLNRRDFTVVRPRHVEALELIP